MRPLLTIQKTALIFYLVYAGLLVSISIWSPVKPVSVLSNLERSTSESDSKDLLNLESSFQNLWEEALARKGWKFEEFLLESETKMEERRIGRQEVKWVNAKSKLLLPETVTKEELAGLITEWETLNRAMKLNSVDPKWGYQKGRMWLRLANGVSVKGPWGSEILPLYQTTLIKAPGTAPNPKWPGLVPERHPPIPPPIQIKPPLKLPAGKKIRVALIIDDVGSVREAADEMLKTPLRLTWAVLPFTPYAEEYVKAAKGRGFEVILHLPLEPLDQSNNPGPGVIKRDWTDVEIIDQLEADLNQIPEAVGVNNHMGSAGTGDERLMDIIMGYLKKKGLYFVDSMTSERSVGEMIARRNQVRTKRRNVFIDNFPDLNSQKRALRELIKIALAEGEAIGIGHVRPGTAEAIIEMIPEFEKAGIEVVPVSELLP